MAGNARPEVLIRNNNLYKLNPSSELLEAADKIKEIAFLNSKEFNVNSPKRNFL
jgi:hypothetical protein